MSPRSRDSGPSVLYQTRSPSPILRGLFLAVFTVASTQATQTCPCVLTPGGVDACLEPLAEATCLQIPCQQSWKCSQDAAAVDLCEVNYGERAIMQIRPGAVVSGDGSIECVQVNVNATIIQRATPSPSPPPSPTPSPSPWSTPLPTSSVSPSPLPTRSPSPSPSASPLPLGVSLVRVNGTQDIAGSCTLNGQTGTCTSLRAAINLYNSSNFATNVTSFEILLEGATYVFSPSVTVGLKAVAFKLMTASTTTATVIMGQKTDRFMALFGSSGAQTLASFIGIRFSNFYVNNSDGGSIVYIRDGRTEFVNCTFDNSLSGGSYDGGGLAAINSVVRVSNCQFSSLVSGNGGAISVSGGSRLDVASSSFNNCTSTLYGGGAIYAYSAVVTILQSQISSCSAVDGGGGLCAIYSNVTMSSTVLQSCASLNNGGAAFFSYSYFASSNNSYIGLTAKWGGALTAYYSTLQSLQDSFRSNRATSMGGAILLASGTSAVFSSARACGNTPSNCDTYQSVSSCPTFITSC